MKRFDCLKALASVVRKDDLVVTNLGNTMHEWLSVRPSRANLYNMNLGQCTPVALGLALALPHRRVLGPGWRRQSSFEFGFIGRCAYSKPANLRIMVFDNEAYESPGGMPSATAHGVDLVEIAKGCGIKKQFLVVGDRRFQKQAPAWSTRADFVCHGQSGARHYRKTAVCRHRSQVQQVHFRVLY